MFIFFCAGYRPARIYLFEVPPRAGWPVVACGFECREEQSERKNYFSRR
jgi:hypothetical protein